MGTISGTTGHDNLVGTAGNDIFLGSLGTDTVDGGAGYDILRFEGLPSSYFYSGYTYTNGLPTLDEVGRLDTPTSVDVTTFRNLERIEFLDAAFDLSGASIAAQVNNLYLGLLNREADLPGLSFWSQRAGDLGISGVATALLNASEFVDGQGPAKTGQLITQLYEGVLGRTPVAEETAFWNGIAQQQGLSAVAVGIAASTEAAADPLGLARAGLPTVDLDGTWIGFSFASLLGRQADLDGFRFFLDLMHTGLDEQGVVTAVVNSQEFQQRTAQLNNAAYVDVLYQDILHRDAGASERDWHVAALEAGAGRDRVAFGFLDSDEADPYRDAQIYTGNVALPSDFHLA